MNHDNQEQIEKLSSQLQAIQSEKLALEQSIRSYRRDLDRFRVLYESSPVPYQSLNADGKIIETNAAWLDKLGYKKCEVEGRWFGDFLSDSNKNLYRTV